MSKQFLQAELKREGDVIEFIATDETLDRHGEKISIDSWDLKNYKKNPVLLVNHDYRVQNIVGKAKNLRTEGKKLIFEPVFHELTDLAKEVSAMVSEGYLNTVSVGFLPHWPEQKGQDVMNELLEVSFVPIPANPRAERVKTLAEEAKDKDLDVDQEAKLKEFLKDIEEEPTEAPVVPVTEEEDDEEEMSPDFEKMDDVDEKKLEGKTVVLLSVAFFKELVGITEKQKTLSDPKGTKKGRAEKDERSLQLLKRVAKEINHALYQANRQ